MLRRGEFKPEELVAVPEPVRPVVLKSGGPVLGVVCIEGDHALCEWTGWEGETRNGLLPVVCLYSCVPFVAAGEEQP